MTNDELEAIRARAEQAKAAEWDKQWGDFHVAVAKSQADIPALLDEVAEWRQAASVEANQRREAEARATRAEAHAERLAGALGVFAKIVPSSLYPADGSEAETYCILLAPQSGNPAEFTGADLAKARSALSAYRGVKDE